MRVATRVAVLTALALAPSAAQLMTEIGLIMVDGTKNTLSDNATIVQSSAADYTSLFCESAVSWDQCIW